MRHSHKFVRERLDFTRNIASAGVYERIEFRPLFGLPRHIPLIKLSLSCNKLVISFYNQTNKGRSH